MQRCGDVVLEDHFAVDGLFIVAIGSARGIEPELHRAVFGEGAQSALIFGRGRIVRFVVEDGERQLVHFEERREITLARIVAFVELVDVGQHHVRAEQVAGRTLGVPAQRRESEIARLDHRIRRDQLAVNEDLALVKIVLQTVADDQVGAEDQVALHVVGEPQPDHRRRDQRRLAAARDDVDQHAVAPDRALQHLAAVDHAQQRVPLMPPESARPRQPFVVGIRQKAQVIGRLGLGRLKARLDPELKVVLVGRKLVLHDGYSTLTWMVSMPSPPLSSWTLQATVNVPLCGNVYCLWSGGLAFLPFFPFLLPNQVLGSAWNTPSR